MSFKFEPFFKPHKPDYKREAGVLMDHRVQVEQEARALSYDLKLDFETYLNATERKSCVTKLQAIKEKILERRFDFDITYKTFVKKNKDLIAKVIVSD